MWTSQKSALLKFMRYFYTMGLIMLAGFCHADKIFFNVWPEGKIPGEYTDASESTVPRSDSFTRRTNVSVPTLQLFQARAPDSESEVPRPAVIICPGGGYRYVVVDKEGSEIAERFNAAGVTALVLKYRNPDNRDGALQDLQRSVRMVRSKANEWNIDPTQIGVIGFSAGGHLAARASVQFEVPLYQKIDCVDEESCRPDFAMLVYPAYLDDGQGGVSSQLNLQADIPPTLIVHTDDDKRYVIGSKVYSMALKNKGVSHKFLLYETGGHGYGLHSEGEVKVWPEKAVEWLESMNVIAH